MAGHHSSRNTSWLEVGEDLQGLQLGRLDAICAEGLALPTHTCSHPADPLLPGLDSLSQLLGRAQDLLGFCKRPSHSSFTRWQQMPNVFFPESCIAFVCQPGIQRARGLRR